MLRSMTAYGRHRVNTDTGTFIWELRSVNHRFLETTVRLPEDVRGLEAKVRDAIANRLNRGKVDVGLRRTSAASMATTVMSVDEQALICLRDALQQVAAVVPSSAQPDAVTLLQWPGVLSAVPVNLDTLNKGLLIGLDEALNDFVQTREREGEAIAGLLRTRIMDIQRCLDKLRAHRPEVVERQRAKLLIKLAELDLPADSQRLEQELVYLAQRLDIDEELDRLDAHLVEVVSVLERTDPVGRRLDFLMQELNREANTIGSKSSDIDTTGATVDMKVLIEQIREQVQNLE